MAPTPCNSNSMWKCPLIPVGLLLSGVRASPHGEAEAAAAQQASSNLPGRAPRPRMATGGGPWAACRDRVHRALTYELTASALVSPLAANSIGHRYVASMPATRTCWGRPALGGVPWAMRSGYPSVSLKARRPPISFLPFHSPSLGPTCTDCAAASLCALPMLFPLPGTPFPAFPPGSRLLTIPSFT